MKRLNILQGKGIFYFNPYNLEQSIIDKEVDKGLRQAPINKYYPVFDTLSFGN